jgi:hypothetical protein
MSMSRKTNSEELAVILARYEREEMGKHFSIVADDARAIVKLARRLANYAEQECNGTLTPRQTTMQQNALNRLCLIVRDRYDSRIEVTLQGDPRGYVVRFKFPNGENNTWSNDFGIG